MSSPITIASSSKTATVASTFGSSLPPSSSSNAAVGPSTSYNAYLHAADHWETRYDSEDGSEGFMSSFRMSGSGFASRAYLRFIFGPYRLARHTWVSITDRPLTVLSPPGPSTASSSASSASTSPSTSFFSSLFSSSLPSQSPTTADALKQSQLKYNRELLSR